MGVESLEEYRGGGSLGWLLAGFEEFPEWSPEGFSAKESSGTFTFISCFSALFPFSFCPFCSIYYLHFCYLFIYEKNILFLCR